MKTFSKVALFTTTVLFFMNPITILAQKGTTPLGGGQKVVISRMVDNLKQEYSSTIDLNDKRKQLIMAGQNYQTNYGIYAKIEMAASDMGAEYRTLKNVEFEIMNYKPTYFIGIDSIVVSTPKSLKELTFKIYTRALSDKTTFTLKEDDVKHIHFEKGSYLHSERILNPMFPKFDAQGKPVLLSDGSVACTSDDGKAFDFEFFYKDGQFVMPRENYDIKIESEETYLNEKPSTLPGIRCRQSFNKIMF